MGNSYTSIGMSYPSMSNSYPSMGNSFRLVGISFPIGWVTHSDFWERVTHTPLYTPSLFFSESSQGKRFRGKTEKTLGKIQTTI